MYEYRRMKPEERDWVVQCRAARGFPLHAPPHTYDTKADFLITASCFEHQRIFDHLQLLTWYIEEIL